MSVKSLRTGTRSISLLAGNVPEHHVLLAETTVGAGGAASVTFSNIPADYQHLQIRGIAKNTESSGVNNAWMRLNSDSATNYFHHGLYGDGASAASSNAVNSQSQMSLGIWATSNAAGATNMFTGNIVDILDYASTSKFKTVRTLFGGDINGSGGYVGLTSGLWRSTSAVTSVTLLNGGSATFTQYTTFALYGIK